MMVYDFTEPKDISEYPKELISALLHPQESDDYYSLCERFNYKDVIDAMTALLSNGNEKRWFEEKIGQWAWDYYLKELVDAFCEEYNNTILGNGVEW